MDAHSAHATPVFWELVKKAKKRTRDRWKSYLSVTFRLVVYVLLILLIFALVSIGFGLVQGSVSKVMWALLFFVEMVAGIIALIGVMGFALLIPLMQSNVIISETIPTFEENFERSKSVYKKFLMFQLYMGILAIALIPLDMVLSAIMKVSAINMLIAFWGTFNVIVIVRSKLNGLDNFWMSRSVISRDWFKNILRLIGSYLLVFVPVVLILSILFTIALLSTEWLKVVLFSCVILAAYPLLLLLNLYLISFRFELYKSLPHPLSYWKPKTSQMVIFIVITWIIAGILIAMYPAQAQRQQQQYMERGRRHKYFRQLPDFKGQPKNYPVNSYSPRPLR